MSDAELDTKVRELAAYGAPFVDAVGPRFRIWFAPSKSLTLAGQFQPRRSKDRAGELCAARRAGNGHPLGAAQTAADRRPGPGSRYSRIGGLNSHRPGASDRRCA